MSVGKTMAWASLVVLACVVLATIVMFIAQQRPGQGQVIIEVLFLGYSNAPDGRTFAQFSVSNTSKSSVCVNFNAPMVRKNGLWFATETMSLRPSTLKGREQRVAVYEKEAGVEALRLRLGHDAEPSQALQPAWAMWRRLPLKPSVLDKTMQRAMTVDVTARWAYGETPAEQ